MTLIRTAELDKEADSAVRSELTEGKRLLNVLHLCISWDIIYNTTSRSYSFEKYLVIA